MTDIGKQIKELREARGMTQAQLGELVGVTHFQVSRIEGGAGVKISTLQKIAAALGGMLEVRIVFDEE